MYKTRVVTIRSEEAQAAYNRSARDGGGSGRVTEPGQGPLRDPLCNVGFAIPTRNRTTIAAKAIARPATTASQSGWTAIPSTRSRDQAPGPTRTTATAPTR